MNQKQEKQMANAVGATCGRPCIAGKAQKGITLIALVITIIVLLILAGVTINMVLGDDGIIQNAQTAKNLNKDGQIEEAIELMASEIFIEKHGGEAASLTNRTPTGVIEALVTDGIVKEGELIPYGGQSIQYKDGRKSFSLDGIVEWDNTNVAGLKIENGVVVGFLDESTRETVTSITIPEGVTSIGNGAFGYCYELTEVNIPDSVTSIGEYAFGYCSSLETLQIPNSVESFGPYAFESSAITSITIPRNMTTIGENAFSYSGLSSITIPDWVTTIERYAFAYSQLTSVKIPSSVTSIGASAFNGCRITSIELPNSITTLPADLFENCSNLESIYIPASVTRMDRILLLWWIK